MVISSKTSLISWVSLLYRWKRRPCWAVIDLSEMWWLKMSSEVSKARHGSLIEWRPPHESTSTFCLHFFFAFTCAWIESSTMPEDLECEKVGKTQPRRREPTARRTMSMASRRALVTTTVTKKKALLNVAFAVVHQHLQIAGSPNWSSSGPSAVYRRHA